MSGSITIRHAADSSFAGGSLPHDDGSFNIDGLAPGRYTILVRSLGYAQRLRSDVVVADDGVVVDLGPLMLARVVVQLERQQVTAERDASVLAPDRNSYSTKNMTAASGGTAIDVLRNIPLVEVDGSNKVSLRNNENVVVQINGRASPLKGEQLGAFLAQLPARAVRTVEVSTNPSAKNDPEGTAGIINLVLNQEADVGLGGGFATSTSNTERLRSASGNVGMQSGPSTFFLSGSLNRDRRATSATISRTNLGAPAPAPAFVETNARGTQRPLSGGGTLRSEYRFTSRDALSLDGFLYAGHYDGQNAARYTNLDGDGTVVGLSDQFTSARTRVTVQDYALGFRRQGKPTEMQLASEVGYSVNRNSNDSELRGDLLLADPSTPAPIPAENDRSASRYLMWNVKSDYTQPFGANTKLEAGFKGTRQSSTSALGASILDEGSGLYVPDPVRSSGFEYRQDVAAAYAVLSRRVAKVQTQAGLRLETAATHLDLPTFASPFDNRYASAFPSASISYDFTALRQARIAYSRRISRPGPNQLNPVEYRQDTRNVFRGNPNLRPEYTDALELGLQQALAWGSVQLNPYLRHTSHAVRSIQFVDTAGVSVGSFDNVASTLTIGSDLNLNVRHGPLTLGGGGSAYRYSSDASNLSASLSTRATVWSARVNGSWKLSPRIESQLSASYRAPYATEGGSRLAVVFTSVGARWNVWGDQGNIALGMQDPFGLLKFGYRTANGTVIERSEQYFGIRAVSLTITRNFGRAVKLRPRESEGASVAPPGGE